MDCRAFHAGRLADRGARIEVRGNAMRSVTTVGICLVVSLVVVVAVAVSPCHAIDYLIWDGGGGTQYWNDSGNWNVWDWPDNPNEAANIPPGLPPDALTVRLNENVHVHEVYVENPTACLYMRWNSIQTTIGLTNNGRIECDNGFATIRGDLTLRPGATLYAHLGGHINIHGQTVHNDGNIYLFYSSGSHPWGTMHIRSDMYTDTYLQGTGTLQMQGGQILSDEPARLTHGADHTIRGGDAGIEARMTNNGLIHADWGGHPISLAGYDKVNNGTMKATDGSALYFFCAIDQTGGGQIIADNAAVRLFTRSFITGGTLETPNGGIIEVVQNNVALLADVTNNGFVHAVAGTILALGGTSLTNNGTIELTTNAGMGWGDLLIDTDLTLGGTGEVLCRGHIYTDTGATLTNGPDHTIRDGRGTIDVALINQGTVSADVSGQAISLETAAKVNSGLMRALGGGFLDIRTPVDQTGGGQILADAATVRLCSGTAITGGTLDTPNGGVIVVKNALAAVTDVTSNGYIDVQSGGTLAASGTSLTNNGTVQLTTNTGMGWGHLRIDSNLTLGGTGEVLCRGDIYSGSGSALTNGPGHTIRDGGGTIDVALINQGTVSADVSGRGISLDTSAKVNSGLMRAFGGGFLDIHTPVDQTGGGQILADNATVRLYSGTAITGGTLDTPNGGVIVVKNALAAVTDVTSNGYIDVQSDGTLAASGAFLTNNGTIQLTRNTGMGWGDLRIDNSLVLDGTGEVLCYGHVRSDAGATLTNGAAHTLRGRNGQISVALDNLGTVEAVGGGKLTVNGPVTQFSGAALTGGTWIARAGSNLDVVSGSNITTNQGTVILDGPGSAFSRINTLADNQGSFSILAGRDFTTVGPLANSGTITVGPGSTLTVNGPYTQPGSETSIQGTMVAGGTVNIGGGVFDIDAPAGGTLDLGERDLICDYTGGASPFDAMADWVASGYAGGTWQGTGIRSSAAAAHPLGLTAVGLIDNNDPETGIGGLTEFAGEPVSLESVLARYTWWGDANLDGILDSNDYDRVDTNFVLWNKDGTVPDGGFRWAVGDFDGDGTIDSNDYDLIDKAYMLSAGGPAGSGTPVPTPEPASAALVMAGLAWVARRVCRLRRG